ncbi:hypothetical protein GCM10020256_05760 [Streptomyces thermocoprophilus]
MTASDGRSEAATPPVQSTATVLVNTDAMPKAMPDAVASSTLRTAGCRCAARPAAISAATAPTVTRAVPTRCGVLSDCASAAPTSDSSPASPTVAMMAPRQAAAPARRRTNSAAIGSANTMVRAPSGWTRLRGPYASATTCSRAPSPFNVTAVHHAGRRNGAYCPPGEDTATCS